MPISQNAHHKLIIWRQVALVGTYIIVPRPARLREATCYLLQRVACLDLGSRDGAAQESDIKSDVEEPQGYSRVGRDGPKWSRAAWKEKATRMSWGS